MTMFMVLSSWPWSLREFTRFIWWMQTECRVAANPQTMPTDLGCESADKWLLPTTSTIAICYYCSAWKLILILPSTKGGRLSRPRHCRKGTQPVPKAVHRSGCRDKHNWPQPVTLQSIMPSLNHCDLLRHVGVNNLPKVVTRQRRGRELNSQPASCKSNALATRLPSHPYVKPTYFVNSWSFFLSWQLTPTSLWVLTDKLSKRGRSQGNILNFGPRHYYSYSRHVSL